MATIHTLRPAAQLPSDEAAALIVIAYDDGRVSVWSKAETAGDAAWADERLMQASGLIARKVNEND